MFHNALPFLDIIVTQIIVIASNIPYTKSCNNCYIHTAQLKSILKTLIDRFVFLTNTTETCAPKDGNKTLIQRNDTQNWGYVENKSVQFTRNMQ